MLIRVHERSTDGRLVSCFDSHQFIRFFALGPKCTTRILVDFYERISRSIDFLTPYWERRFVYQQKVRRERDLFRQTVVRQRIRDSNLQIELNFDHSFSSMVSITHLILCTVQIALNRARASGNVERKLIGPIASAEFDCGFLLSEEVLRSE
jgi:hypothetical protein